MSRSLTPIPPKLRRDRIDAVAQLWSGRGQCRLVRGPGDLDAAGHAALGLALLKSAAAERTDWLRCYRPPRTAAFSGLDRLSPGADLAWKVAIEHGFAPVRRGPGGRMAAYHRESLCVDLVMADLAAPGPAPDPWSGLASFALLLVGLLQRHGIDARCGEIPGEYCPGRFSVNVGDRVKVAGTAARRVRGATLLSAALVVDDVEPIRTVTTAVYSALPLPLNPATVGSAADYAPELTTAGLTEELLQELAGQVDLVEAVVPLRLLHPVSR